ncbi:hypothetical protein SAMN04488057_115125 [Cyclobacterium lianum]|uniref:Uncharacterized protein n=2 Tax=Cyclobacterium lianum TaxID=388280 RepID=A0A1M7Q9X6_9BACT|nr:hypothetical protein SAMN04488057_115125 [Cyclobacterium lianum]
MDAIQPMSKIVRPLVTICLSFVLVFQWHFLDRVQAFPLAGISSAFTDDSAFADGRGALALLNDGMSIGSSIPKSPINFGDPEAVPNSHSLLHFGRILQCSFENARTVNIKFGVREVLFPSHFFW